MPDEPSHQSAAKELSSSRLLAEKNQTKQIHFILDSWLLTSTLSRNPAVFLVSAHSHLKQLWHASSSLLQLPSTHLTPTPVEDLTQFCWKNKRFQIRSLESPTIKLQAPALISIFPFSLLLPGRGDPPPMKAKLPTCALDPPQSISDPSKGRKRRTARNNFPPLYF